MNLKDKKIYMIKNQNKFILNSCYKMIKTKIKQLTFKKKSFRFHEDHIDKELRKKY
jgi:hypothetical protein